MTDEDAGPTPGGTGSAPPRPDGRATADTRTPVGIWTSGGSSTGGSTPHGGSTDGGDTAIEPDPVLRAYDNWRRKGWDAGPHFTAALSIVAAEDIIRSANTTALRPAKLTHARHEALALIYFSRNGELPLNKLSARLMVHPTSTTSTVDTLERLDLAERVAHPTDRRTTLARITPRGRTAIESSCAAMTDNRYGLGALTATDAQAVFDLLQPLRATANTRTPRG
jgi:DNA-binding MarR family transcriptional regulator